MAPGDEEAIDRYIYRSASGSRRHRHLVSVYLVERRSGSNVVARIEPLGLVSEKVGEHDIVLRSLRRNLVLAGSWRSTPSLRHDRVRVRPVEVTPK